MTEHRSPGSKHSSGGKQAAAHAQNQSDVNRDAKKRDGRGRRRKGKRAKKKEKQKPWPPIPDELAADVVARIFKETGRLFDTFPEDVTKEVEKLCAGDGGIGDKNLEDRIATPYITIDNDNSMDLDQAMHISRTGENRRGYLVSYALADGAYYVSSDSALFKYAVKRGGSSFYLPGKCIPMLPRKLSEDVMSLNEGVVRRSLVFDIELDESGKVVQTTFVWAKIKSVWKGTYREASEYYEAVAIGGQVLRDCPTTKAVYRETLDLLKEVGLLRIALAKERHVVRYNRQGRAGIAVGKDGKLCFAKRRPPYSSEAYNEQISLLCNSEGAKILLQREQDQWNEKGKESVVHPIFRNQSAPDLEKVDILAQIVPALCSVWRLDPKVFGWSPRPADGERAEYLADYLDRMRAKLEERRGSEANGPSAETLAAFLVALERSCMLCNQSADFAPVPKGHFSLRVDACESHACPLARSRVSLYLLADARFSSPMREAVGCFTHKELRESALGRQTEGISLEDDLRTRNKVIKVAKKGKRIQKDLSKAMHLHMMDTTFYKHLLLETDERPIMPGVIVGIDFARRSKRSRLYVSLEDPPLEIKIYGGDLAAQWGTRYVPSEQGCFGRYGTTPEIRPVEDDIDVDADADGDADDGDDEEDGEDEEGEDGDGGIDDVPAFRCGMNVNVKVLDYIRFHAQPSRNRWAFGVWPR